MNLDNLKKQALVLDLETMSHWPGTLNEINIHTNFPDYIANAQIRWVGLYSYQDNQTYIYDNPTRDKEEISQIISSHKILIAHNGEDFDLPILINNGFMKDTKDFIIVDTMIVLGKASFHTKKGFPFKNRGDLMEYDFASNSLRTMAEEMKVETQKGDIDYHIFEKLSWTDEEKEEITKYLNSDVHSVKQIFDKLWEYWLPFTKFLPDKSINDLSWIRGSIASVIYKSACNILGVEPTYADKVEKKEAKGGNVILPRIEEANNVFIIDFASLYPHIFCMANLFHEVDASMGGKYIWHGNEMFHVKGYYDISRQHPLSKIVTEMLKDRLELKKTDPKNPLVYTYKIFLNGLYGVVRSPIFEKVHKPSAGWDCCDLGQQFQKLMEDMMLEFGFRTLAGDTDAIHVQAIDDKNNNSIYLKECLQKIVKKIKDNVPFPVDTFNIAIEKQTDYILYPFEDAPIVGEDGKNIKIKNRLVYEKKPMKKNYLYIYTENGEKKIEIKGFPIIKNNSTKLGYQIYEETLKEKIINKGSAKFLKSEIEEIINSYLLKPETLNSLAQEYKVKPAKSYKKEGQIQAQISKAYFGNGDGVIKLIKNNLVGKCGKGKVKYATIEEINKAKVTVANLDLTKLNNELQPFILFDKNKLI